MKKPKLGVNDKQETYCVKSVDKYFGYAIMAFLNHENFMNQPQKQFYSDTVIVGIYILGIMTGIGIGAFIMLFLVI